jgi:hypothetical protein
MGAADIQKPKGSTTQAEKNKKAPSLHSSFLLKRLIRLLTRRSKKQGEDQRPTSAVRRSCREHVVLCNDERAGRRRRRRREEGRNADGSAICQDVVDTTSASQGFHAVVAAAGTEGVRRRQLRHRARRLPDERLRVRVPHHPQQPHGGVQRRDGQRPAHAQRLWPGAQDRRAPVGGRGRYV